MKILCVSDQIDPLVYSSEAKEYFKDIDIILCAGDLAMEYVDYIVSTLNKPTYFVFGNHNLEEFCFYHKYETTSTYCQNISDNLRYSHGATYLGFKTAKEQNVLMAGCSGSMRYNNGLAQYTENQMFFQLIKMIPRLLYNKIRYGRYIDIFLTHASPLGIHDKQDLCHKGFACYRWFIKKFKPKYMIHGHIHLYDLQEKRISEWNSTTVINAFSHYVLEYEVPHNG
ncbi:MAG: metallophosphoesterase [Spirochaetales bacterium]